MFVNCVVLKSCATETTGSSIHFLRDRNRTVCRTWENVEKYVSTSTSTEVRIQFTNSHFNRPGKTLSCQSKS